MRIFSLVIFSFLSGLCAAQHESLDSCMDQLPAVPAYAVIAGKLAMGAGAYATSAMLADTTLANNRERQVVADWAAARAECVKADSRFGNDIYRPPIQTFGIGAESRVMAAAVELYDRKISFGEFNQRRQIIAEELRAKVTSLQRQIQSQLSAQEQADQLTREREQMQREIEEMRRQAELARRQSAEAQGAAGVIPTRPSSQERILRPLPPRIVLNRYCFRFGDRIICTVLQ
jgi:hypothetical protein